MAIDVKAAMAQALGIKQRSAAVARQTPGAIGKQNQLLDFGKWDMTRALKDGYEINEWVTAAVNILARHAASVPWRVSEFSDIQQKAAYEYERKGVPASELKYFLKDAHKVKSRFVGYKGDQPIYEKKAHLRMKPEDPLEQLLERPNPFNTRQEYIERLVQHLYLGGNAMWVKLRAKAAGIPGYKTPVELWPLFPQAVEIEVDGQVPKTYRYAPEGKGVNRASEKEYPAEDVLHFAFTAPGDAIWGTPPLMAAARSVDTDVMAARFQLSSMSNRGLTDYLISFKEKLGRKEYAQARRMMAENRTGPENARAPWMLGNQANVQRMSMSTVELDYIRTRGLNRQAICSVFNVYPPVIAVMEGATSGAIESIMRLHWTNTMIPLLDNLMAVINTGLVPEFGNNKLAWFDPSNVEALNENLMDRYRMQKVVHTQGVPMTILNDRFDLGLDLDGVVGADTGWFPAGVVPAHIALEGGADNEPGNPNTNPEGGDPGEPGDPTDPNEEPIGSIPNDPSVENPGNLSGDPALEWSYFTNGHADPHEGKKRWSLEEAVDYLTEKLGREVEPKEAIREGDHFMFNVNVNSDSTLMNLATDEGKGIFSEDLPSGILVRMYHGEATQRKRDMLLDVVRSWS